MHDEGNLAGAADLRSYADKMDRAGAIIEVRHE